MLEGIQIGSYFTLILWVYVETHSLKEKELICSSNPETIKFVLSILT